MKTTDLHQHFDVEYDKANVISAYPSFLPEEKDIWLNKAYSMLLSQKFTGNNYRKIAFEGDIKRTSDLQRLIKTASISTHTDASYVKNAIMFDLTLLSGYLYYIGSTVKLDGTNASEVVLTSHTLAQKVKETDINKPWIPRPTAEIEDDNIILYYDTIKYPTISSDASINVTYLSNPSKIDSISLPNAEIEVGDNVALEIINLAVVLALENIESQRMETKGITISMQE